MNTRDYILNLEQYLNTLSESEFNELVDEMYEIALKLISQRRNSKSNKEKQLTI